MEMAQKELMNILPQKFHIPSSKIRLLNSIGHGTKTVEAVISMCDYMSIPAGEFGEVYKAHLTNLRGVVTRIVAVKTLRGNTYVLVLSYSTGVYAGWVGFNWVVSPCIGSQIADSCCSPGLFTPADVQMMLQEVVKMKDLNHPHIMSLIGVCFNSGVGVVMPYMANGSVLSYLKKEQETLFLQNEADVEQVRVEPWCSD